MKNRMTATAVIRLDPHESASLQDRIVLKGVYLDGEFAEREVERLNKLNGCKGCVYFATHARIVDGQ